MTNVQLFCLWNVIKVLIQNSILYCYIRRSDNYSILFILVASRLPVQSGQEWKVILSTFERFKYLKYGAAKVNIKSHVGITCNRAMFNKHGSSNSCFILVLCVRYVSDFQKILSFFVVVHIGNAHSLHTHRVHVRANGSLLAAFKRDSIFLLEKIFDDRHLMFRRNYFLFY